MTPGIFESVFARPKLAATFQAVAKAGFGSVQFDLASAGLDPWVGPVSVEVVAQVREDVDASRVRIPAVSGTFNMAHPDMESRKIGLAGFERVAAQASSLGASFVTLCTGTRDPSSMWRWHAENASEGAWADMIETVTGALEIADRHDVVLVMEPEPANVVSSAVKARRVLDQLASDRLKVVLDPANIVLSDRSRSPKVVLDEAFALLGPDIVFAHAKDLSDDGEFCAAGTGIVPWERYWRLLDGIGYNGDVIFHTLTEADVPLALALLPSGWRDRV